jgi:hypothetical protein
MRFLHVREGDCSQWPSDIVVGLILEVDSGVNTLSPF